MEINYILLGFIIILNIIAAILPGPNYPVGGVALLLVLLLTTSYKSNDVILANGELKYKLWIKNKFKTIPLKDIKNIYLRYIEIDRKKKVASIVVYTNKNITIEIPVYSSYKKRYQKLLYTLNEIN